MASRTKSAKGKRASTRNLASSATDESGSDPLQMAALVEYLAEGAVSELVIVEVGKRSYRVEALLTWKPRRNVLTVARGGVRMFRSVDTIITFFRKMGVRSMSIRLELKS